MNTPPAKIMIVEDELISVMSLECLFEDEGYTVSAARSGVEALALGRQFKPDVLVTDWKLKDEIDGIEVARQLKAENPELKAVIYSGLSVEDLHGSANGVEIFRFLEKPCDFDEMLAVVREALAA